MTPNEAIEVLKAWRDNTKKNMNAFVLPSDVPFINAVDLVVELVQERDRQTDTWESLVEEIRAWQRETFPSRTPHSISEHLKREAAELAEDPLDDEEMADVALLLVGLSEGRDLLGSMRMKLEKNKARVWGKPDAHGVVEHVKESTVTTIKPDVRFKRGDRVRLKNVFRTNGNYPHHGAVEWVAESSSEVGVADTNGVARLWEEDQIEYDADAASMSPSLDPPRYLSETKDQIFSACLDWLERYRQKNGKDGVWYRWSQILTSEYAARTTVSNMERRIDALTRIIEDDIPTDAELIAWVWRCGKKHPWEFVFIEPCDGFPMQLCYWNNGERSKLDLSAIDTPDIDSLILSEEARSVLVDHFVEWRK